MMLLSGGSCPRRSSPWAVSLVQIARPTLHAGACRINSRQKIIGEKAEKAEWNHEAQAKHEGRKESTFNFFSYFSFFVNFVPFVVQ
jgi:hypothetical protein